jgi:hypothetical protein
MMGMENCMENMGGMWGMMAGMGLIGILLIIVLGLGIAALVKYLFSKDKNEK